jgi:ubiquinone/menaquinone biosynthesis C-methylase UbiE
MEHKHKHHMQNKQMKLETPSRLEELNPLDTLKRIGLTDDSVVADIGAGSGIFTLPAARASSGAVYALETDHEMLKLIDNKARSEDLPNIIGIHVEDNRLDLGDNCIDIVLMVTVLHELADQLIMLQETRRIMKEKARLAIVEFHPGNTPNGPPPGIRLAREEVYEMLDRSDLTVVDDWDLGENMYCVVAQPKRAD